MTLVFETVHTASTSQLSYLIGDDDAGIAAVVDPRPDVDVYLELARRRRVAITHVFDTHNHADYLSGARELADRVGGARVSMSGVDAPEYGFEHDPVRDGDRFVLGGTVLTALHTPGHTREHLAYLVAEKTQPDAPYAVLSGDSLLVGSAGRPDLMGDEHHDELTEQLHRTLYEVYLGMDDGVLVLPGHGAGSACGADIGDRPMSTIGYERRTNEALRQPDLETFRRFLRKGAPPEPAHYARLKKTNARGTPILGRLPIPPALPAQRFEREMASSGALVLDTRDMLAFGGGHIPGAVHIGARPELSGWAGDILDPERELLLVLEDDRRLPEIVAYLLRVGLVRLRGYLVGGMRSWNAGGRPLARVEQITVDELQRRRDELAVLDVRTPDEWESGHVPGATHRYLGDLRGAADGDSSVLEGLDETRPIALYCGSGYRASLAASLLQRQGRDDVLNVPGSWLAWTAHDLPVADEGAS